MTPVELKGPDGKALDAKRLTINYKLLAAAGDRQGATVTWQRDCYVVKEGERVLVVEWSAPLDLAKSKNFFEHAKLAMATLAYKPEPLPTGVPAIPPAGGVVPPAGGVALPPKR